MKRSFRVVGVLMLMAVMSCCAADSVAGQQSAPADAFKQISDFDAPAITKKIRPYNDVTNMEVTEAAAYVKQGKGSLKVTIDENKDPRPGGDVVFDLMLDETIDMSEYQALTFWVYVPESLIDFFYGRRDVRVFPNVTNPSYTKDAVKTGWNKIEWDFKDLYMFPQMHRLRIQFGRLLAGYKEGVVYVDDLKLHKMAPLGAPSTAELKAIIQDDPSWPRRYQAVKALGAVGTVEVLDILFGAIADGSGDFGIAPEAASSTLAVAGLETSGSQVVRSTAYEAVSEIIAKVGMSAAPQLETALKAIDKRTRQAAVKLIRDNQAAFTDDWANEQLYAALLDDIFFVREAAIEALAGRGQDGAAVARRLRPLLVGENDRLALAAARVLSEIGPAARPAVAALQQLVRSESTPHDLRCWAVCALWCIDETELTPSDWAVCLPLQPGRIHRHLLNRAMDRLVEAGEAAVGPMIEALASQDAEVRVRAASVLRQIGPAGRAARAALEKCLIDNQWYVRYEAAQALLAIDPDLSNAQQVLSEIARYQSSDQDSDVRMTESDGQVSFDNGRIELVFRDDTDGPGPEVVRRSQWGQNLFNSDFIWQLFAYKNTPASNIIEVPWFQKIFGVPINKNFVGSLVKADADHAEYVYTFPADDEAPIEWKLHYVLRRGDSGFYWYITSKNFSGKALDKSIDVTSNESLGSVRLLPCPTWNLYDTLMLHDNLKGPAGYTFEPRGFYPFPDIYQATYRVSSGQVDAKHEWHNYELDSPVLGYCNEKNGLWFIVPSMEALDDCTATFVNNSAQHNIFVIFLEGKYYSNTATKITEDFEKLYGPFYFYVNSGENREEIWIDAKRKAQEEIARWPHGWIQDPEFHQRGSVRGTVKVAGAQSPEDAWVILCKPRADLREDYYGEWWHNINPYKYWTQVAADGTFEIDDVRPDNYDIFVWKAGIYGQTRRNDIVVEPGNVQDVGQLTLTPVSRGELVWQIGVPNRTPAEFKNGNNFHQWDNFLRYRQDFPNDVHYVIGESDYTQDWNYLQPETVQGEWKPVTWTVEFDLDAQPQGQPVLTVVYGGRDANFDVILNGEKIGEVVMDIKHIGANIRSAPYDELLRKEYRFDPALLRAGANTLLFTSNKSLTDEDVNTDSFRQGWYHHIGYDFIRLEIAD